ncbi:hypothetical protein ACFE04_004357 [Oxalis oulophora]
MLLVLLAEKYLLILSDPATNLFPSGPYGLIFASFVPFYFDIPVSRRFRVSCVNFSDKTFIYLASLQLILSSWSRSIVPGICGLIAGSLYRLNIFGIRKMKNPIDADSKTAEASSSHTLTVTNLIHSMRASVSCSWVCGKTTYPLPSNAHTERQSLQTSGSYNIAHRGSNGEIPEETAAA